MDTILEFLHELRGQIIERSFDGTTIVRIDVDATTPLDSMLLVVIVDGRYLSWYVAAEEWLELDTLLNQIMDEVFVANR